MHFGNHRSEDGSFMRVAAGTLGALSRAGEVLGGKGADLCGGWRRQHCVEKCRDGGVSTEDSLFWTSTTQTDAVLDTHTTD